MVVGVSKDCLYNWRFFCWIWRLLPHKILFISEDLFAEYGCWCLKRLPLQLKVLRFNMAIVVSHDFLNHCRSICCDICIPYIYYSFFYSLLLNMVTDVSRGSRYHWRSFYRWLVNYKIPSSLQAFLPSMVISFSHNWWLWVILWQQLTNIPLSIHVPQDNYVHHWLPIRLKW